MKGTVCCLDIHPTDEIRCHTDQLTKATNAKAYVGCDKNPNTARHANSISHAFLGRFSDSCITANEAIVKNNKYAYPRASDEYSISKKEQPVMSVAVSASTSPQFRATMPANNTVPIPATTA